MSRRALLLALPLALSALAAACGGGASPPSPSATAAPPPAVALRIEDVERVVLTIRDVPLNFQQVPGAAFHMTTEDTCSLGNPGEVEKQDCLRRLREWRRLDSYQVLFRDDSPEAGLSGSGVFEVLAISSLYQDREGAARAFVWGREQLLQRLDGARDAALVSMPPVGDESLAFVVNSTQRFRGRDIPLSFHTVDFRRGNVLVRVTTVAPQVLARADDALALARLLDERILRGGEEPPTRRSPSPAPATTATP